ncbi:hypothetical protein PDESU_05955 [Pontiella desulfatans]|uniref:Colicin V production protein n=1 Tax=Pontiella desulfatans TaxID=2750659 RepID=A0A6C2UBQ0_PONDE|nr:CvpA family protein [Pontiella desulfatans]VGO17359.1 hypothetical protein PDESU_05955 [Pontiella desulfatans]
MPEWLSLIDVAFVAVAVFFAWSGFQKGFAAQVAHILSFLIMGGFLFFAYPTIFSYYRRLFRSVEETYLMWLILAGMAVLAIFAFVVFSRVLAKMLKAQSSEIADGVYGFFLGLVRGLLTALVVLILLVMVDTTGRVSGRIGVKSFIGQFVCQTLVPRIQPRLAPVLEENIQLIKKKLLEQEEAGQLEEEQQHNVR